MFWLSFSTGYIVFYTQHASITWLFIMKIKIIFYNYAVDLLPYKCQCNTSEYFQFNLLLLIENIPMFKVQGRLKLTCR